MRAMVLKKIQNLKDTHLPLELEELPQPVPQLHEILIKVTACGVCHTEIDEIEGRTPPHKFPIILGHEVVGRVVKQGPQSDRFRLDERVGVAWIYKACGRCEYCRTGQENLCPDFQATGRDAQGGYAEYMRVPEAFAYPIPDRFEDVEAAPLLCAGAIGYRSLRLTGIKDGASLGLTGFGASAHLVLKLAAYQFPQSNIYVFARNPKEREFARELGAEWAGDTTDKSPQKINAIIDTTPVWKPVVEALQNLKPGGRLVINAIRKEERDLHYFEHLEYARDLWMEKEIKSVANVTRRDVAEFLKVAADIPLKPEVQTFPLEAANQALMELKESKIRGAKVLKIA